MELKYLYEWETIAEKPDGKNEKCFLEEELKLRKVGIRVRVAPGTKGFVLSVPLKNAEVARDFLEGRVVEVIDKPAEMYHVFDKDLNYANENLQDQCDEVPRKYVGIGRFWFLAVVLLMMLVMFRFIEF